MKIDFLQPDEFVIMQGNANMKQVLGITKGGHLVLTNQRLVFVAHAFNVGSKFDEIPFNKITSTNNTLNILIPSPNMIEVTTIDGNHYQFVVTGKQKEEWKLKISQCIANYNSSYNDTSEQPLPNSSQTSNKFCSKCGTPVSDYIKFCGNCGNQIN